MGDCVLDDDGEVIQGPRTVIWSSMRNYINACPDMRFKFSPHIRSLLNQENHSINSTCEVNIQKTLSRSSERGGPIHDPRFMDSGIALFP